LEESVERKKSDSNIKMPTICTLHKQVLLAITGTLMASPETKQKNRIRNKNPNCNHNSSHTFYQPSYHMVKLDDNYKKKEETLRRYYLKLDEETAKCKQGGP